MSVTFKTEIEIEGFITEKHNLEGIKLFIEDRVDNINHDITTLKMFVVSRIPDLVNMGYLSGEPMSDIHELVDSYMQSIMEEKEKLLKLTLLRDHLEWENGKTKKYVRIGRFSFRTDGLFKRSSYKGR